MKIRGLAALVLSSVLFVVALGVGARAADGAVQIRRVDAHEFPAVTLTVSVDGAAALTPSDVTVTEAGRSVAPIAVQSLAATGREIDVVLVIDTSDSMAGRPLAAAFAAAVKFMATLPTNQPVKVGLVEFSGHVKVVRSLASDRAAILAKLRSPPATHGGTALFHAVVTASKMFSGQNVQRNIVLLSDGGDRSSGGKLSDATGAAKAANAAVFSIGLRSPDTDAHALQTMSQASGGEYAPAATADLAAVYQGIGRQLAHQYLISYRSGATQGGQTSITVSAGGGTDTSLTLFPTPAPPPSAPALPVHSTPLLHGTVGLAVILGLSFLAVFLLFALAFGATTQNRRRRRLARMMTSSPVSEVSSEESGRGGGWIPEPLIQVAERMAGKGALPRLRHRLEQGEVKLRAGEFLMIDLGAAVFGGAVVGILLSSPVFGLVGAVLFGAVPWFVLAVGVSRRSKKLHAQLPDVLMMLSSSLRAGHGFMQALDTVAQEVGDPMASELSRVVAEVRLGRRPDDAMSSMGERVDSDDFRWAAMAVNIQREAGGNLAEILDTVAETVRERDQVRRQIEVLSAEGRLSMWILGSLPFLIAAYIAKVNPSYLKLLFTSKIGVLLTAGAAVLLVTGIFWLRKIVKIDV